ncbi:hypothetical protein [Bradyrhizobium sp.]|uniref:hypothetical protein n=1 Tax=Bradyrhizobium sp. TaxID=376 RepID=UPI00260DFCB6|nr:hypothetical protein [Bradyrhizobium sp.]
MLDIDDTIDAFRRGALDFDCKRMVLAQRKKDGERFEGQGYVRQSADGTLVCKIYVAQHNAKPFGHFAAMFATKSGEIISDDLFYDLDATGHDGTRWTSKRIRLAPHWDATDLSVLVNAQMQSITAHLDMPQRLNFLRLHFFDEYVVPLHRMSETEKHGNRWMVRDLAEFEACGSKFEVRKRDGSGDTTIEVTSESPFPAQFNLRIQEALQYITAKTAIYRARLESAGSELHLELASSLRKAPRTQFNPPIAPISIDFHQHGWRLFGKYLEYVIASAKGTYWNPVAYHLYNACEATAGSLDAWAVGVSVAVEALTSLISVEGDKEKAERVGVLQDRMREWFSEQADLQDFANRINGQIDAMGNKRPHDTLHVLAETGHVTKEYIKAWNRLRQRHVHPTIRDLKKPDQVDYQELFDLIHRTEVLLRQLTFYLIGYEGPFTDYGVHADQGPPSAQYPLRVADSSADLADVP